MRPVRPSRRDARVHGDARDDGRANAWEEVWSVVRRIPRGRVMTYGQISELLGQGLSPRAVGWAMHRCPERVPWQRVVNASGRCSTDRRGDLPPGLQQALLEAEGVRFDASGALDLERFRHRPRPTRRSPGRSAGGRP